MTKAQIKDHQRTLTAIWLEGHEGKRPPRERIVLNLARRGYRGAISPNRARRWVGAEPMRLKTLY